MPALRYGRQASTLASWGLGQGSGAWWHDATCTQTPELHLADVGSGGWIDPHSIAAQAVHICRTHCPVRAECEADTAKHPPAGMVQAGQVWVTLNVGNQPAKRQPPDIGCGHHCADLPTAATR